MMRRIYVSTDFRWVAIGLAMLLAFSVGCASTPDEVEVDETVEVDSEFDDASMDDSNMEDTMAASRNFTIAPVYFDLDKSDIRSEFGPILRNAATSLKDSGATVVIEGHCDERGSEEYNIALGERRAVAVRKYLYNLGVPMAQMSVVSYGEADPAVSGTGETAWQLNRRAEFKVQ